MSSAKKNRNHDDKKHHDQKLTDASYALVAQEAETDADRGSWQHRFDFLISLIAYAIGLGNVWRFPYLCYKNGGGVFLIPYWICWILAALPIFYMEVSIGQFLQRGGMGVWKICPVFKGVGIANIIISCMCNIYYCVIAAWALYYLFASFASQLPWVGCDHVWNNNQCLPLSILNASEVVDLMMRQGISPNETQSPVEQFWERRVLDTSSGIHETGSVKWDLALLLLLGWVIVYFALWKGITKARKFMYVCAISPYILLFILFGRGITLDGAVDGIKFYLSPNITKLASPTVWKDAGTQVFYSYGIGFGTLMALGSYNKYDHNALRDSAILCCINFCTSFLAGFVVFSVLGHMAFLTDKTVGEVVKSGVGLAFLVYPEVVVNLPGAQFWSALFFLMIAILGMDSQVCTVEGVITALTDEFPKTLRKHKEIFVLVLCVTNFLLGLLMVSQGGQYWLTLVDAYGASGITLLLVVFCEVVGLAWGFGTNRIYDALEDMRGVRPRIWWSLCWRYFAPAMCVIIFLFIVIKYEPLSYADGRSYPEWSQALGFLMTLTSIVVIPGYAVYYIWQSPGKTLLQKMRSSLKPSLPIKFRNRPHQPFDESIDIEDHHHPKSLPFDESVNRPPKYPG